MLKYVTYEEYIDFIELLDKSNLPNNFNKLVIEASSYINKNTFGRIDENNIPKQVKYTTCLIINLLYEQEEKLLEIGNLKAQNIEGWSETYCTPEEIKKDYSEKMYTTLKINLWNVIGIDSKPLLYSGV